MIFSKLYGLFRISELQNSTIVKSSLTFESMLKKRLHISRFMGSYNYTGPIFNLQTSGQNPFWDLILIHCFVHPIFRLWSLLAMKLQKCYVIFVYILHGKMGKTEKNRKENHATKVTKIPKTKRWKNGMKKHKSHKLATLSALSTLLTVIFWANLMTPVLDKTHVCGYNYLL